MSLQEFKEKACLEINPQASASRTPGFINYNEAYYRVNTVYNQNVVGAFQFSLAVIKEFIAEIDQYNNSLPANSPNEIQSIRAWKAVSKFNNSNNCVADLLLVPVRVDGDDSHAHSETSPKYSKDHSKLLMLGSLRPCPNLCGNQNYFHTSDPGGDSYPDPNNNPYQNCVFPNQEELGNDIDKNTFIE